MFKPRMLALASLTAVSFSSMGAEAEGISVKVIAGDQVLMATFYDNATS